MTYYAKKPEEYKQDWLNWWLSDDPPPPSVASKLDESKTQANRLEKVSSPKAGAPIVEEPGATYVTVNLNVPKISLPDLKKINVRESLKSKEVHRIRVFAIFAISMMLAGLTTHNFITTSSAAPQSSGNPAPSALTFSKSITTSPISSATQSSQAVANTPLPVANSVTAALKQKASFVPVAPANKRELANYAFAKTSYDSSKGTYTYIDVLQGSVISVTEQEPPSGVSSGQEAAAKISSSLGAKEIATAPSGVIYAYTDLKTNKQTLIFSISGLLISINSNTSYSTSDWVAYINSLQ